MLLVGLCAGTQFSVPLAEEILPRNTCALIDNTPMSGELCQLENVGIKILACGTCLSRLQLTDKVAVGQVSNMYAIADALLRADKVISL